VKLWNDIVGKLHHNNVAIHSQIVGDRNGQQRKPIDTIQFLIFAKQY
jgi:hypothetical protein